MLQKLASKMTRSASLDKRSLRRGSSKGSLKSPDRIEAGEAAKFSIADLFTKGLKGATIEDLKEILPKDQIIDVLSHCEVDP